MKEIRMKFKRETGHYPGNLQIAEVTSTDKNQCYEDSDLIEAEGEDLVEYIEWLETKVEESQNVG